MFEQLLTHLRFSACSECRCQLIFCLSPFFQAVNVSVFSRVLPVETGETQTGIRIVELKNTNSIEEHMSYEIISYANAVENG